MNRLGVVLAVVASLALSGCGPTDAESEKSDAGSNVYRSPEQIAEAVAPIMDDSTGVLAPGSARFNFSMYETMYVDNVTNRVFNDCIVEHGVTGPMEHWVEPDPLYAKSSVFLWQQDVAARYGFAGPAPLVDLIANGVAPTAFSEEELAEAAASAAEFEARMTASLQTYESAEGKAAVAECRKDPEYLEWKALSGVQFGGPWTAELDTAREDAFQDPRMFELEQSFAACVTERGLTPYEPDDVSFGTVFSVEGIDNNVIDEQQIRLATTVVECRTSTGVLSAAMQIWAEYEGEVYARYPAELDALAAKRLEMLDKAREFWAAND